MKKSINFFILTVTKFSDFISLKGSKAFRWSFCSQKTLRVAMTLWRYGIRKFDVDAILYGDTGCKEIDTSMF